MASSRSKWEDFFKGAGIPTKPASEYATKFCDNRVRHDMLEELNKEVLHELGVKAIGDVIAILRHSKVKQAEMSRQDSSSPPDVEITGTLHPKQAPEKQTKHAAKSVATNSSTKSTAPPSEQKQSKGLSMTVKADLKTTSKTKQPRKTLSDRFCEYENEAKKKKEEVKKEVATVKEPPVQAAKAKPTVFTIQLPSKQPLINNSTPVTPSSVTLKTVEKKQRPVKVTLVPAQGKALNRNKQSTSIFDRLDKTPSGKVQPSIPLTKTVAVTPKEKKGVFSRLGDMDSDDEITSSSSSSFSQTPPNKTQEPTIISSFHQSAASSSTMTSSSKNVFSRLGDR